MRKITRTSYGNGKMVTTLEATGDGEEVRLRWSPSAADCAGKTRHTDSLFLLCSVLFCSGQQEEEEEEECKEEVRGDEEDGHE